MTSSNAMLVIDKGEPFEAQEHILLTDVDLILGRTHKSLQPDIAFADPSVSRRHASISYGNGQYYITDLNSNNGTMVNDILLESEKHHPLQNNYRISLSKRTVVLFFF